MRRALVVAAALLAAAACTSRGGGGEPDPDDPMPIIGTADCPAPGELLPADKASRGGSDRLPDVTLPCLGSERTVSLRAIGGMPTVLNLWASWCAPCRKEMPYFERAAQQHKGRVRFLGVNTRDFERPARVAIQNSGISYASVVDRDEKVRNALRAVGMPVTVFVDADGRIVYKQIGEMSETELRDALREHFGVG